MVSGSPLEESRPGPSWRRRLLVALGIASLIAATGLVIRTLPSDTATPPAPPSIARPSAPVDPFADEQPTTFRDGSFGTNLTTDPTASKSQSKLWIHDGTWWAVLLDGTTAEFRIYRLDWQTQRWIDTGTVVDDRAYARQDVLVDGDAVLIASAGSKDKASHAGRLLRFTYEQSTGQYRLDPDYPVQITPLGAKSLTIARDGTNELWIAYISELRLYVNHSAPGDFHHWAQPLIPSVRGTAVATDQVALVSFRGSVGIVWSNQIDDAVYFARHKDSDAATVWQETSTVVEGLDIADDHINARVLDTPKGGILFVAAKTSLDKLKPVNQLDPQLFLLELTEDGTWQRYLYGRVEDRHTRPILLLDDQSRELYMFATAPFGGGQIFMKRTPIDAISFETGRGELFMSSTSDTQINTATSTKQNVNPQTGIVVLAADNQTGRYVHGILQLGRPQPPQSGTRDPDPQPPSGNAPGDLINNSFDSFRLGRLTSGMWELAHGGSGRLIVQAGRGGRFVELATTSARQSARACQAIPPTPDTRLRIDVLAARGVVTKADSSLASVRANGVELVTVRFGRGGTFAYYSGGDRVKSTTRYTPRTWYRLIVTMNLRAQTFAFEVRNDSGRTVLKRAGLRWRNLPDSNPDRLCLGTGSGRVGETLRFDDVRVVGLP